MIDLKNKWTLITGASRGIGYLTAKFMAEQGSNLILHSRNPKHCAKIEAEAQALGVQTIVVSAELSKHQQVIAMLDEIDAKCPQVDIVFNNAAVQVGYRTDFWKTPVEDFDVSFRINTIAVATICNHLMPRMIERGFGRVINTTSGIRDQPEQSGYSASKAALDKYTKDIATKVEGTDVCINITDPGWCRTDLGGPQAPNDPTSAIPGVAVGAFINDKKSGRFLNAPTFTGMTLEEAVTKAHTIERDD